MSQILVGRGELRQQWPGALSYVPQSPGVTEAEGVPEDEDMLASWAYVGSVVDVWPCCQQALLFRGPPGGVATVKVYGVVADARLTALGNWTTRADEAAFASRWLELSSGGNDEVFASQLRRLEAIQRYAAFSLRGKLVGNTGMNGGHLRCRQTLFSKVVPNKPLPRATLETGDDPLGAAAAVADEWVVTCNIPVSRVTPGGEVKAVSSFGIKTGDFVEADIAFDVIMRRGKGKKGVEVRFVLLKVLKLSSQADFEEKMKAGKQMVVDAV